MMIAGLTVTVKVGGVTGFNLKFENVSREYLQHSSISVRK